MITKYTEYIKESLKFNRVLLDNKDDISEYMKKYFSLPDKYFVINDDLTVDIPYVPYSVSIKYIDNKYNYLPINFGVFDANLDLSNLDFITLEGCPKIVNGHFDCRSNKLTTLVCGPEKVNGWYSCNYNNLTTLEGAPKVVKMSFSCTANKLETLKGFPKIIQQNFQCLRNQNTLKDIKDLPFDIFEYCLYENESWLLYLDKDVLKEYLEYYLEYGFKSEYYDILKHYIKKYNLEDKYKYLEDAKNFDLI